MQRKWKFTLDRHWLNNWPLNPARSFGQYIGQILKFVQWFIPFKIRAWYSLHAHVHNFNETVFFSIFSTWLINLVCVFLFCNLCWTPIQIHRAEVQATPADPQTTPTRRCEELSQGMTNLWEGPWTPGFPATAKIHKGQAILVFPRSWPVRSQVKGLLAIKE